MPSAPSTAANRPARSQVHPARRPATSAHPAIWSTAAASARLGARLARPCAGPSKREEERRNDGRFDQWPLATGDDENVAVPKRLSRRDLLADDLRPPVGEPEDERGAERARRHDVRVLSSLEGDADDRGNEKRPVDGRSEPHVVASARSEQRSRARLDLRITSLPHRRAARRRPAPGGSAPRQRTPRRGTRPRVGMRRHSRAAGANPRRPPTGLVVRSHSSAVRHRLRGGRPRNAIAHIGDELAQLEREPICITPVTIEERRDERHDRDGAGVGLDEHHGAEGPGDDPVESEQQSPPTTQRSWIAAASMRTPMAIAQAATT